MDGQHTAIYEQTWVSGELVTSQYVEEISTTSVTEVVERGTAVSYVEPDDKLVNVTTQSDGSGYLTFGLRRYHEVQQGCHRHRHRLYRRV